jgi:hypothetical protein
MIAEGRTPGRKLIRLNPKQSFVFLGPRKNYVLKRPINCPGCGRRFRIFDFDPGFRRGPEGGCLATIGWHGRMKAAGAFNGLPRELTKCHAADIGTKKRVATRGRSRLGVLLQ